MAEHQDRSGPRATVIPAAAKEFVDQQLGPLSSHPVFARKKAVWLFRMPMLAVLAGFLLLLWKGVHLDVIGILQTTQAKSWAMILVIGVGVFLFSMVATAVLSIRASVAVTKEGESVLREKTPHARIPLQSILVLAAGAVGAGLLFFFLPRLIPAALMDPAKARKYAFWAVLLPYVLTLALFDWFTPGCKRLVRWPVLLGLELCATSIFFTVSTRAEWALKSVAAMKFGQLPFVGPTLAGFTGEAAQGFFRLTAAVLLGFCVWTIGEWTLSGIPGAEKKKPEPKCEPAQRSLFARVREWFRKLLHLGGAEQQVDNAAPKAPEWFEELCASLPSAIPKLVPAPPIPQPALKIDNPSPLSGDATRNQLFGGLTPSVDQLAAATVFARRKTEFEKPDANACRKGMDLLLEGGNGVGKTTSLMACALESLLVRGERVVLFASDPTSRARLVTLLNQALEGAGTQFFFNAEELSPGRAQSWLASPDLFPDILVSSPEEWEDVFFGDLCDVQQNPQEVGDKRSDNHQTLKAWLRSVTTMMVDDVASPEWSAEQVTQLPFLIDKQRLLLAEAGRQLQMLATTTGLPHDAVREALMRRLFGYDVVPRPRQNLLLIRSWRSMVPPRAQVNCTAAEPVMFHIIRRGLRLKKQVLVFLPEGNTRHREEKRKEFLSKMQSAWSDLPDPENVAASALDLAPEKFRIICHLNENIGELTGQDEDRIILYQGTVENDMILPQLVSRYGSDKTVVFALNPFAAMRGAAEPDTEPRQPMGYPLLVAREALPLMIAHLRSAAIHLKVGAPISRDAFSMFGLRPAGLLPLQSPVQSAVWKSDPVLKLLLDPEESTADASARSTGVWPMACFLPSGSSETRKVRIPSEKADMRKIFKFGASYHLDATRQAILFGHEPDESDAGRLAIWKDQSGVDIDQVDLAFLDELLVGKGDERFWCRVPDWDINGRVVFRGDPYRKLGHESIIPVWSVELIPLFKTALPEATEGNAFALGVRGPWQGTPEGLHVAELFLAARAGQVDMSTAQVPAFEARISIKGSLSSGRDKRSFFGKAVDFTYPAAVTAVLLGVDLPEQGRAAAICSLLAQSWNTEASPPGGEFWPELTLAMQTTLKRFAPRCTHFCRFAAFRLPKQDSLGGGAVVFFIEPQGTCGTISPLLKAFLDYSAEIGSKEIVGPALEALGSRAWRGPGFVREEALDPDQATQLIKMFLGSRETISHEQ